jgi:ankyrin repeat protein
MLRPLSITGYTPLHRACYNGRLKAIGVLLARGADVNAASLDGWTPLHSAARWAKAKAITLLLENGSNVNAQTNGGLTALHLASSTSTLESTEGSAAIECSVVSASGVTSLCRMLQYRHVSVFGGGIKTQGLHTP